MPFEGELFSVPKEYDALLTVMYGDYMTLPPESKRVLKFADEGVDIGRVVLHKLVQLVVESTQVSALLVETLQLEDGIETLHEFVERHLEQFLHVADKALG